MSSPRSMWSGSIELGLLNIPVTVGKAWSDEKEPGLVQVCYHGDAAGATRIDRSERCSQCNGAPQNKRYAVEVGDQYRLLDEKEVDHIQNSTRTITLVIQDAQPLSELPMIFATGCYYLRHDEKAKVQPRAMNRLVMALGKTGYGLICQWGNASSQKLCVISAERGVLIMRVIPHLSEIRIASKRERSHFSVPEDRHETEKMVDLLNAVRNQNGFDYASYVDHGLELRQAAVKRILEGGDIKSEPESPEVPKIGFFEALENSISQLVKA